MSAKLIERDAIVFIRRYISLIAIFSIASISSAQTLDEAIRLTLRTNPDVLAQSYSSEAAKQLVQQA